MGLVAVGHRRRGGGDLARVHDHLRRRRDGRITWYRRPQRKCRPCWWS